MPLLDVVGNAFRFDPEQIGETCVKVGIIIGITVIVILVVLIQEPVGVEGVKVYSVVLELSKAGDQIPVILLFEIVGNGVIMSPEQTGAICVNVGVLYGFTVMVIAAVFAQAPFKGVKV